MPCKVQISLKTKWKISNLIDYISKWYYGAQTVKQFVIAVTLHFQAFKNIKMLTFFANDFYEIFIIQ